MDNIIIAVIGGTQAVLALILLIMQRIPALMIKSINTLQSKKGYNVDDIMTSAQTDPRKNIVFLELKRGL